MVGQAASGREALYLFCCCHIFFCLYF